MDNETLATEMLRELKATSKRKDGIIIFLILVNLIIVSIFVWYINQPIEEYTTLSDQDVSNIDNSDVNLNIGE